MTPLRSAFFDCPYGVTAGTCSDLTPVPIHNDVVVAEELIQAISKRKIPAAVRRAIEAIGGVAEHGFQRHDGAREVKHALAALSDAIRSGSRQCIDEFLRNLHRNSAGCCHHENNVTRHAADHGISSANWLRASESCRKARRGHREQSFQWPLYLRSTAEIAEVRLYKSCSHKFHYGIYS